jgi:hypothetical protein
MLEDFIHEGLLVNNVLNLIDDKEFDQARMAWISGILESGIERHCIIRDGTTDDDDDDDDGKICPSKRKRTPKHKYSPSDDKKQAQNSKSKKREPYPIGLSVVRGSTYGREAKCKYCRACIMKSNWRVINKVKREGEYDTSQYHLRCVKDAFSPEEVTQILAIIKALVIDPDEGSISAMIRCILPTTKKTAWDYIREYD